MFILQRHCVTRCKYSLSSVLTVLVKSVFISVNMTAQELDLSKFSSGGLSGEILDILVVKLGFFLLKILCSSVCVRD